MGKGFSKGHVAALITNEMRALGISKARLVRHSRKFGVGARRVNEALEGNPGHLKTWNQAALRDWIELVRGAWLA